VDDEVPAPLVLYEAEEDTPGGPVPWEQPYFETYKGTWGGGELRLVSTPITPLRVTVGSEVTHHWQVEMKTGQNEFDGSETPILDLEAPYTVFAGYGLAEWQAHKKVLLSAGVRADRWDLSQDARSLETGENNVAEDFTSINPRVAVILKPTPANIVKLMGGRAFRAPSTYEYFYTDGGTTQVTSDCCGGGLEPEIVYSGEVEYTHRFNEDWSALGSGHALLAQHIIETVPVPEDIIMMNGFEEGKNPAALSLEWGVRVLNNEKVTVDGLQIVGVHYSDSTNDDHFRSVLRHADVDRDRASILLTHAPDRLKIAEEEGFSLQLSGHTHGGQFFPFTWITSRMYGKFVYGLQRLGNLIVYVSYGAGTWGPPLRLGTTPEIVLIQFE